MLENKPTLLELKRRIEDCGNPRLIESVDGTYIYFWHELDEDNPKTEVWTVRAKESHDWLGKISWYGQWRKYIFASTFRRDGFKYGLAISKTIFEEVCMREIANFIEKLTKLQREKWRKERTKKTTGERVTIKCFTTNNGGPIRIGRKINE